MIVSVQRLAQVFVEIADTLDDEFDAAEFLHTLTLRIADVVGASAVGILLADSNGELSFAAASDEGSKAVEIFQAQVHEGPCESAFRSGKSMTNVDLRTAGAQWPRFAPQAIAADFRVLHAFPLRARCQVVGALTVFSCQADAYIDDGDTQITQALADAATIALLQQRTIGRIETLTDQLQNALNSRIVIEQAKGAIAHAHQITVEAAFHVLRSHARRNHQKLSVLAQAVVRDPAILGKSMHS